MISCQLLRVTAPHFVAGAEFQRDATGHWHCTNAAPIIKWMQGNSMERIKNRINSNPKWTMEWVKATEVDANLMNTTP